MSLYTEDDEEEEKYIWRDVGSRGNGAKTFGACPTECDKAGR